MSLIILNDLALQSHLFKKNFNVCQLKLVTRSRDIILLTQAVIKNNLNELKMRKYDEKTNKRERNGFK